MAKDKPVFDISGAQQELEEPVMLERVELPKDSAHEALGESAVHVIAPEPGSRYMFLFLCLMALVIFVCVDLEVCVCFAVVLQGKLMLRVHGE